MQEVKNREKEPKEVFRKKRRGPITFNVKLTEEQKEAKARVMANTVSFLTGKPGTSKSLLACHVALDYLISGEVGKIVVTRPTVLASRDVGFLPGDAFDFKSGKLAPFLAPILQAMYKLRSREEIDREIDKGNIEIIPIQFIRGLNFEDCVVIVDEGQNLTSEELKAVTTRLCKNSKLIITSDYNQIDLRNKNQSASNFISEIAKLDDVDIIELKENFRHDLALAIMDVIDRVESEMPISTNILSVAI